MNIRERILGGAAELFRKHGIKSVTMDSIAGHLGISKRTIYEVFTHKDDLVLGVLLLMAERQGELVRKILDESENSITAIFRLLEFNRDHFQDMNPAFHSDLRKYHYNVMINKSHKYDMPDYRNNIEVIDRGISEKLFREDINPDLVNRCLFSLGRSIIDDDLYPFEQFSRRDVVKHVFINYLKGISTPKGISLIEKLEGNI